MSSRIQGGDCENMPRRLNQTRVANVARCVFRITLASCLLAGCGAGCLGGTRDAARARYAVEQYTEAMECQDRARRLSLFARAEQVFRQIIEGDAEHAPVRNAALYVNMGNAALQAERLGPAIVAYRRALALAPRNAQARHNLAYARSLLPVWIRYDDTHGLLGSLFFWRSLLTASRIKMWAAICFLLAAALVALSLARRQPPWRSLAVVPLTVWAVMLGSLFLVPARSAGRNAVVVQEARVYTADSTNAPPRLSTPLPSGAELTLIQQRSRWLELRLPDGRAGWVRSSAVRKLGDAPEKS